MPLDFEQDQPAQQPDYNAIQRNGEEKSYSSLAGPNGDFAVPAMEELGLKEAASPHRGGETIALRILDEIIRNEKYTATFEKPKVRYHSICGISNTDSTRRHQLHSLPNLPLY